MIWNIVLFHFCILDIFLDDELPELCDEEGGTEDSCEGFNDTDEETSRVLLTLEQSLEVQDPAIEELYLNDQYNPFVVSLSQYWTKSIAKVSISPVPFSIYS